MIEIKELKKYFGKTIAVNGINCVFQNNTLTTISGASGSGKTTLLKMIGLITRPTAGTILIDGVNYFEKKDEDRAFMRNQKIGFVFQDYKLDPSYSVGENIALPLLIKGINKKERRELVEQALKKINLLEKMEESPTNLSGGQQQRVAIARALINNPDIILADEPCGNLDEENKEYVYQWLCSLKKGKIVIVVTHEAERISDADQRFILAKGELADGNHSCS